MSSDDRIEFLIHVMEDLQSRMDRHQDLKKFCGR